MGLRQAFVTLDTTGLPSKIPGWTPRIVALGLAVTEQGKVLHSTGGLIQQPAEHVEDPRTRGAWEANGIDPASVIAAPATEIEVAASLKEAVRGCTLRGYNVDFLSPFLWGVPYYLQREWGRCVMEEAKRKVFPPDGRKRAWQDPRFPTLNESLYWATARGHDVTAPNDVNNRAHANAVRVAKLAIAMESERP